MTFGLTPTGFVPKTADDLLAEIEAAERGAIAADLDTSAESVAGQLNGVMVPQLAELWELGAAVSAARSPAGAGGAQLDGVCALTGTQRRAKTKGRTTLRLGVTNGFNIAPGAVAQAAGQPGNRWVTLEAADNSAGFGPVTIDVAAEAQTAGKLAANAGTISVIATPVAGWVSVTNPNDAAAGDDDEADPPLRARRENELSKPGTSPVEAVRADLLAVRDAAGVLVLAACLVEENASAYADVLGRPPHALEAVVQFRAGLSGAPLAAARLAIAAQLWKSKAGGIPTYGSQSATVLDTEGAPHVVSWSEPTVAPVYVNVVVSVDAAAYAGDAALKDAFVAYGATLRQGDDVVRARLIGVPLAVAGVRDVPTLDLGTSSTALRALNLAIGPRQLAGFDTSRITVTST